MVSTTTQHFPSNFITIIRVVVISYAGRYVLEIGLAYSLHFIYPAVASCREVSDMCSVKWRKVGERYSCSIVRDDGTEELITAGTREKMIGFLRTHGFEHIDPGLIEDNLDSWCS